MAVTLSNATLATLSPPMLRRGHVTVDGATIVAIDDGPAPQSDTIVECAGKMVVPGNVCGHTHLYSALARGMPAPRYAPRNFPEILEHVWWRLDRALDQESTRSSAVVGAMDAIRAGTTTLIDHHASPSFIRGSLDVLADGLQEVGVRAVLCYEVTDRNGREGSRAGIEENARFLTENRRRAIRGMVGAHASFTLEDPTLEAIRELAGDTGAGVHIHVAEDVFDEEDSLRRSALRAAMRLDRAGLLGPKSIVAHGVHLDGDEIAAIRARNSWFVHNCRSNLNNNVGRAPVRSFGENTALGTDGIDEDMFAESRTAFFRAREDSLDSSAEWIAQLLSGGGVLASQYFEGPIGALEVGAAADLVVLDYNPPTPLTAGNLAWHWMFALTAANVESVMVDGSWVLRDRAFQTIDEEKARADARGQAERLWARMDAL